jgi:Arylsulfatase regulator (Fe-S oxidoreductase)
MMEMVEAAEARAQRAGTKVEFHITTNGTLISDAIANFMDRHRFTVFFSIDGDQERHDQCRPYTDGRGSFADVAANLERLRARPNVHLIGSSVIRDDLPVHEAVALLRSLGTHQCKVERAHGGIDFTRLVDASLQTKV